MIRSLSDAMALMETIDGPAMIASFTDAQKDWLAANMLMAHIKAVGMLIEEMDDSGSVPTDEIEAAVVRLPILIESLLGIATLQGNHTFGELVVLLKSGVVDDMMAGAHTKSLPS